MNHVDVIDYISKFAKLTLSQKYTVKTQIIADEENLYDIKITLDLKSSYPSIKNLSFSYDSKLGYFLDIDSVTMEYSHETSTYVKDAKKFITALSLGKLIICRKRILGFITRDTIKIKK